MCYFVIVGVRAGAGDILAAALPSDLTPRRLLTHSLGENLPAGYEPYALLFEDCSCELWHLSRRSTWSRMISAEPLGMITTDHEIHWRPCLAHRGLAPTELERRLAVRWASCDQWVGLRPDVCTALAALGRELPEFYWFVCFGDDSGSARLYSSDVTACIPEDIPDFPVGPTVHVIRPTPWMALDSQESERAFLAHLRNHPADTVGRKIFADWLEEQGDPRADIVRLSLALASRDEAESKAIRVRVERDVLPRWFGGWRPAGQSSLKVTEEGMILDVYVDVYWDRWLPVLQRELGMDPSWVIRIEINCDNVSSAAKLAASAVLQRVTPPVWVRSGVRYLDDDAFPHLTRLPTLQVLVTFPYLRHQNTGLAALESASRLEALCLNGSQEITDDGLASLTRLPNLRHLSLYTSQEYGIRDEGDLDKPRTLTDEGLMQLLQCPQLESLSLTWRQGITVDGVARLCRPGRLRHVSLWRCSTGMATQSVQHPKAGQGGLSVSADDHPTDFPGVTCYSFSRV